MVLSLEELLFGLHYLLPLLVMGFSETEQENGY